MYYLRCFNTFFDDFLGLEQRSFNGRLRYFSYCGIFNRRDIFTVFSRQLFCTPWFHEIFLQIFWLLFTFEFLTQNSHLSMDVKFASVWFNFLLIEGWVIKIDANLALITCKTIVWLVLPAGLLIFMLQPSECTLRAD